MRGRPVPGELKIEALEWEVINNDFDLCQFESMVSFGHGYCADLVIGRL